MLSEDICLKRIIVIRLTTFADRQTLNEPSNLRLAFFQSRIYTKYTRCVEAKHLPFRNRLSATRAFLLSGPVLARFAFAPIHRHFIVCKKMLA